LFLLYLSGERKLIFKQQRVGQNGNLFWIYKIRTMQVSKNKFNNGNSLTLAKDPRVPFWGAILRRTKIDELPQFINIFKGELSFVGPRPLVPDGFSLYTEDIQKHLKTVKPGVTSAASLHFINEEMFFKGKGPNEADEIYRNKIIPLKGSIECDYISEISFLVDLKILIKTVFEVLFKIRFSND
tara:strand:+ start:279 stop:830 length:552 start_codon:yes stop_codon:yes gene_type:complete